MVVEKDDSKLYKQGETKQKVQQLLTHLERLVMLAQILAYQQTCVKIGDSLSETRTSLLLSLTSVGRRIIKTN